MENKENEVVFNVNKADIDDEVLIKLVKVNPILYDKCSKNYKNNEMKKEVWGAIAASFVGVSREDLENRFAQLRNQLSKKLCEMKQKQPSGSGGGMKIAQWPLMGTMSFLIPHINSRKTRGSLIQTAQCTQLPQSEEKSVLLPYVKLVCSPSCSSNASSNILCSETSSSSIWNNEVMENICESANDGDDDITNMIEEESFFEVDNTNSYEKESVCKKKKTPRPDTFQSSKKKKGSDLEAMLLQSSTAFQDAAKAVTSLMPAAIETEQTKNPYAAAIIAALEQISADKMLDCFLAIMNTIQEYRF